MRQTRTHRTRMRRKHTRRKRMRRKRMRPGRTRVTRLVTTAVRAARGRVVTHARKLRRRERPRQSCSTVCATIWKDLRCTERAVLAKLARRGWRGPCYAVQERDPVDPRHGRPHAYRLPRDRRNKACDHGRRV